MALYRLLQKSAVHPDDIERMVDAYESVLTFLNMPGGDNPFNQTIAQYIIECAQTRENDPDVLYADALDRIGKAA